MLKNSLIQLIARISLGKQLATAVMILRLVADALQQKRLDDLARLVYKQLPASWRDPKGSTTEREFVEAIEAGQRFLQAVHALAVK